MINLARIHAYKAGIFDLFDCPKSELNKMKTFLIASGFVITHVEFV